MIELVVITNVHVFTLVVFCVCADLNVYIVMKPTCKCMPFVMLTEFLELFSLPTVCIKLRPIQ